MVGVHAVRLERAARRGIAGPPGRDRPDIALRAIDRDRHLLRAFVDGDEDAGVDRRGQRQREGCRKREGAKPTTARRAADRRAA